MRGSVAARWLVLALALACAGCVEYHESLIIERDGSGTAHLRLGFDETFVRLAKVTGDAPPNDALRAAFDGRPGVAVLDFRRHVTDGLEWQEVDLRFDSLERLEAAADSPGQVIRLRRDDAGHLVYERVLDLADQHYGSFAQGIADGVLRALLGKYRWTFEVRFPSRVVEADTAPERIDGASNTVRWEVALASSIGRTLRMRAVILEPSRPLLGLVAGVGSMLVLITATAVILRRRRRRRAARAAGVEGGDGTAGPAPPET